LEGIANYIFSFLPQNTETPQLWAELEAASGPEYPVEAVMKTWTEQKGFPVITVQSKQVIIHFIHHSIYFVCAVANYLKSRLYRTQLFEINFLLPNSTGSTATLSPQTS
jgi:hypothetical protein